MPQTVSDLGKAFKQANQGAYDDLDDASVGRAVKLKHPGAYDDFADVSPSAPVPPNVMQTADEAKSTLGRLGSGFYNATVAPLKHIWEVGGPRALEEMGDTARENLKTYSQTPTKGNYVRAVPLIGPPTAAAYDQFQSGDVAGGIGNVLGTAASLVAPELMKGGLLRGGPNAAAKGAIPPVKPAVTAMKALDIPAGIAEQNGWMSRQVTRFLQNRALGREPMFNFLQGQNTAANAAAGRIGESMGAASSPIETGMAIHGILNSADESAVRSAIDAEAERTGRLNADAQAQSRAGEMFQRDLAGHQKAFVADRQRQQAASVSDLRNAAASVGESHSPEATGQAFTTAVGANAQAFKAQARKLYADLDEKMSQGATKATSSTIDTGPISRWMYQLHKDLSGVTGATAALKGQDVTKIMDMAKRWDSLPDHVTFADGMDILSALKSIGRDNSQLINSRYPGVAKKLTSQLEAQMQDVALRKGPEVLSAYQKANDFYREGVQLFNESSVADLMDKNPEQISQSLWKPGNVTPIKEAQAALAGQPQAWAALQRRGIDDLFERSMRDGVLDAGKLRSEWSRLGPEVQQAMTGYGTHFDDLIKKYTDASAPHDLDTAPSFGPASAPLQVKPGTVKPDLTPQQKTIRNIVSTRPESLAPQLLSPNSESIWGALRSATRDNPDLYDQTRRQAFESLVAHHSGPPVAGGAPVLQGKALVRAWRDLGPHVQSYLAGDALPQVNQLMSAVNALETGKLNTMHNAIYGGLIDPSAGAFGINALAHGDYHTAAATAAFLIAPRIVAKAITSPTGIKWLTEGLGLPAGTRAAGQWMARAGRETAQSARAAGVISPQAQPQKMPKPPLQPPPSQGQ